MGAMAKEKNPFYSCYVFLMPFFPLLQPTIFRKLDLFPFSCTVEKLFLLQRRTETINLLRAHQICFSPFPFQFEEGGRSSFQNVVGFPA